MRVEHLEPGRPAPAGLVGAVLARDIDVAGERWPKGRRLGAEDLNALARANLPGAVTVLIPDDDDVHEDDAAVRLARAAAGGDPDAVSLALRGPAQSRVDLLAAAPGVVEVRIMALERLNRLDSVEVFTIGSGRIVAPGDLVASAKVAPHLVPAAVLTRAEALAGATPIVRVRPFRPTRFAVIVKEPVSHADHTRFEASIAARVAGLGATLTGIAHVPDDPDAVEEALAAATRGGGAAGIVLTAGGASTDPGDAFFVAVERLGGHVVRHGVPAHPGSMLWVARLGRAAVVGLPSCGAYSRATAADLLLPLLVAGYPASTHTVALLAHGGVLDRTQRYRFPAYARDLDAPEG
jgi:molybdopterin biosynthesis enzyme